MFKRPETLFSDYLPFEGHIRDGIVLMKKRGVMAMFEVGCVAPGTADAEDLAIWFDQLHGTYKNIAAEDVQIHIYECRGEATRDAFARGIHRNAFAADVAETYENHLFTHCSLYANPTYFAIELHPPQKIETAAQYLTRAVTSTRAAVEALADRLDEICGLVQSLASAFKFRRLGFVERGDYLFDEIAESLVFALTGTWRAIGVTTGRMGNAMFSESINFPPRKRYFEIDGPSGVSYAAMFALKEYMVRTKPGMFHHIAQANYRCTLIQSFRFFSNPQSETEIGRKQHRMVTAEDKAYEQIEALDKAANDLLNRDYVLGSHSIAFLVFGVTLQHLAAATSVAHRDMGKVGATAVRLTSSMLIGTLAAGFLSLMPGGSDWCPRPGYIKSSNFVAFAPLYSVVKGHDSNQWGPPIINFRTLAGTILKFGFHIGGTPGKTLVPGSTLITGRPGSGKTFLTAMLILMSCGRARIIGLDHKRGWKFLTQAAGGTYGELGAGRPVFSPLKALNNVPPDIEHLTTLLRGCIGGTMTEEEGRRLSLGLSVIMQMPRADRNLRELRPFFDDTPEGAGARLEKWIYPNELGWVIDAPEDKIDFSDWTILDVTALLENPRARGAALAYLFYRILLMLDGNPVLIPIDEGWRMLLDPFFSSVIEILIRTIRSKNAVVVFITQEPNDLVKSGIADVLLTMCPTQFHLSNQKGSRATYIDGLKMSEGQYEAFRGIRPGEGTFLLIQDDLAAVAQMPMQGLDRLTSIMSATEQALVEADRAEDAEEIEQLEAAE